jgi:hypothetical protein
MQAFPFPSLKEGERHELIGSILQLFMCLIRCVLDQNCQQPQSGAPICRCQFECLTQLLVPVCISTLSNCCVGMIFV